MQRKHFFKVSISKLENALFGGSNQFFSLIFFCFSFENNRHTNVILVSIFEIYKKSYSPPKTAKMEFLTFNNFFQCVFKNTIKKNMCASSVFKAESKVKHEEKIMLGFFFKNQKLAFSRVQNSTGTQFLKLKV